MRTSAYKRPQGKGSPAVSYYPKGMLVRGGGKGRDGGFARARGPLGHPPPKGRQTPGPTLYGAGRHTRREEGAGQGSVPLGKARAHGLWGAA